jgi:hypothetical protein
LNWATVPLATAIERLPRRVISRVLHLIRADLRTLLLLAVLLGVCWLLAARGLRGGRLALWLLVPFLVAGALVCWVGPNRLFPKKPFEGPQLVVLSENHAITLLDLPGVLCAASAIIIGVWLIRGRWEKGKRTEG